MAYQTGTLTGTYLLWDGSPASGTIEIIPNSPSLVDAEGDVILSGRVKETLDADGSFSVVLPSTDDETVEPATGRQYTVAARLRHGHLPAITLTLAAGETVDMADVSSATATAAALSVWLSQDEYQAALAAKLDAAQREQANGVAGLTSAGKLYEARIPDRLSDASLSATYAAVGAGGVAAVALGNSVEDGSGAHGANTWQGKSYVTMTSVLANGRLRLLHNGGKSGDTMAQMLARWDAEVVPFAPKLVFLGSGENDLKTDTPAQAMAALDTLVAKCRSIGALPVVHTCVPRTTNVTISKVVEFNLRLARYAAERAIPLLDFYSWLVSETDGTTYANGAYTSDGTHTSALGANYLAGKIVAALAPFLPPASIDLARSTNDPHNLFVNGLMLTDANADGVADNWGSGGAAGVTRTLVTVAGVPGKMQQLDNVSAASRAHNSQTVAAGGATFVPGDVLRLSGRIQADDATASYDGVWATFTGTSEPALWTCAVAGGIIPDGVICYEFTVPAGCTAIVFNMSTLPGVGKVRYGQMTLRNLTKLGITGVPANQPLGV